MASCSMKYPPKNIWVVFVEILSNAGQIFARLREMLYDPSGFLAPTGGADVEIRNVPIFEKLT